MFITVLGSSACRYDYGNDTASFLINNKIIVDTGWNLIENILDMGLNPAELKTILFTHFHHDHYISLPQFLFYHHNCGTPPHELTFIGPADLNTVVNLAMDFLQAERFFKSEERPWCVEIKSGGSIAIDLDDHGKDQLFIETHKSIHPVDGRFYRITDMTSEKKAGFSGDTAFYPGEMKFFKDCELLIHECSLGGKYCGENQYLHASAEDAAVVAAGAGVERLALVHYPENLREECRSVAAERFSGEVLMPVKGDVIYV